jgi:isoquinoline 1-oxidoreductase beta subunit
VLDVLEVKTDRGGSGVVVIATGYWPAKQGRDALAIEWDTSAVDKVSSDKQLAEFKALAKSRARWRAPTSLSWPGAEENRRRV